MGPANTPTPSRPKHSWDIKTTPWTDAKGSQDAYVEAVELWEHFHDTLPATNSNKIPAELRGVYLKSQLYGRARDLVSVIDKDSLCSDKGVSKIIDAICKKDALSVVTEVYKDFTDLLSLKRKSNEQYRNFEARFAAQVAKFNSHGKTTVLHESLYAMMLLSSAEISDSQRIPILASSSAGRKQLTDKQTNDKIASELKYEDIASILRQCDGKSSSEQSLNFQDTMSVNTASTMSNNRSNRGGRGRSRNRSTGQNRGNIEKQKLSPEALRSYKLRTICTICKKHGHWHSDHNNDGSIKDGLPSIDPTDIHNYNNGNGANINRNNNNNNGNSNHQNNNNNNNANSNGNVVAFMTTVSCNLSNTNTSVYNSSPGPLVDDGAPFSAIGMTELRLLRHVDKLSTISLDPKPHSFDQFNWWQFGTGSHSSARRRILGSINLTVMSDYNNKVLIRHLVVEGSSQWVIGRNVTRASDVLHYSGSKILLPPVNGSRDSISMIDDGLHSYICIRKFKLVVSHSSVLTGNTAAINISNSATLKSWSQTKRIIDKVHRHTCGHSTYSDIKTLLERNKLWNDDVQRYLSDTIRKCTSCVASSTPPPSRKVALGSLNRSLNDVVMIDHFYLDQIRLFHCMDSYSRFSAVYPVPDGSLSSAIIAFESTWIAQFWHPVAVQGDQAFSKTQFMVYLQTNGIVFRPVPSRRHHKNTLEPKHGIIRSIFLRLVHSSPNADKVILALRAVSISNDLYGSDVLSAFEIAKGYTKPIEPNQSPYIISEDLVHARDTLIAKRKLNLIMRSKATIDPIINPGDMVQVYIIKGHEKHGKWLSPRIVLSVDKSAGTVTIPGSNGHKIVASIEDTRSAIVDDDLASSIVESIDQLDYEISDSLLDDDSSPAYHSSNGEINCVPTRETELTKNNSNTVLEEIPTLSNQADNANHVSTLNDAINVDVSITNDDTSSSKNPTIEDTISHGHLKNGDRVEIFWPLDGNYYPGTIKSSTSSRQTILYDDGDKETVNLANEKWRQPDSLSSSSVFTGTQLVSNEQSVLSSMLENIGNKSFMRHHAQGFQQPVLIKAYKAEEEEFKKKVSVIPKSDIPANSNIISSHVIYKIKTNDDNTFKLKARIAPHGNEDSIKTDLKSECNMCSPCGVRIVLSIASLKRWRITKADVKAAFLQTGMAQRDVYVIPPRESTDKDHYWLLLTAAYGLVNANAKWQCQSDDLFLDLGLTQCQVIPQLFYIIQNGELLLLAAKIVDDILVTGEKITVNKFLTGFDSKFKFGTVAHGPGTIRFYGMNIVQNENHTCMMNADDKLEALEPYPITRLRRRETDEKLSAIEKAAFMSLNSSLGWLGIAASPFCAFYSSYLQQKLPDAKVSVLQVQSNSLKVLKKFGTSISFPRPSRGLCTLTVAVFADAGRQSDHGQLSYISGLLIGPLAKDSIFHTLSWMSHKSKRPVRSIAAAEILAASEAIDEGKTLKSALSTVLLIPVRLIIIVDSKDLYTSLSTRKNSIDRSIRADVNVIRFEYETGSVDEICWLPGNLNLADPGTKTDSPLSQALQLLMYSGKIPIDLTRHESRRNDRSLG